MSDALVEMLDQGMASDFWAWFVAHVEQEWGPTGVRYQAALDRALAIVDDNACAAQARQVRSGQKAILALLRLPEEARRRAVGGLAQERGVTPVASARPPLPGALATEGRRGLA